MFIPRVRVKPLVKSSIYYLQQMNKKSGATSK